MNWKRNGNIAKRFYILAKKTIPLLYPYEHFDYTQLIRDFKYWNINNNAKMRWAMAIVNLNDSEEKEGN